MSQSSERADLTSPQQQRLRQLVGEFETAWRRASSPGRGPDLRVFLPAPDDPLRRPALEELIKVDLLERWQRRQAPFLETYLETFGELGAAEDLAPELVLAEYRARHLHGDCPPASAYSDRFPAQFPLLRQEMQDEGTYPARPGAEDVPASVRPAGNASGTEPVPEVRRAYRGHGEILPREVAYRLVAPIGRGGFGQVWRAEAPGGVEAAVKVIFRPSDHEDIRRELQALEVIKRLRHPFLLATHAYWSLPDRLIIAMELADGTLQDRLKECAAQGLVGIPPAELVGYFREAAEAIDYLHQHQVLHRDIKPANLLLLNNHVKVADFGLVRLQENMRLAEATFCGTPQYMPPEVWDRKVCPASDQYSLATTYAELRLGCRPFSGRNLPEVELSHREGSPKLAALGEGERLVLLKALAKDPANRYPSCRDFLADLGAIFPVSVRPSGVVRVVHDEDSARRTRHMEAPPLSLPPATPSSSPTTPAVPRRGRAARPKVRFAGWAALLVLALAAVGWFVGPLLIPGGSVELDPPAEVTLLHGKAVDLDVGLKRAGFGGPVSLTFSGLPAGVKATGAAAEGGATSIRVTLTAARDAAGGDYTVRVETADGPKSSASFALTLPELPAGCEPASDTVVTDRGKRKLYDRIRFLSADGPPIEFVLVPRFKEESGGPDTFYIMKHKVAVRDFRAYVRRHGVDWKSELGDEYPALGVRVQDAYGFATKWVRGGKLPTTDQWDKAAGRKVRGREGPYQGKWGKALEGKVAVGRDRPMRVGEAEKDVSPFHCQDMSGNGLEWTRTTTLGELNEDRLNDKRFQMNASVKQRGRSYRFEKPLQFAELEGGIEPSSPVSDTSDEFGFRVVIEP